MERGSWDEFEASPQDLGLLDVDRPLAVATATDILHSFVLLPPLPVPNQTVKVQQAEVGYISALLEKREKRNDICCHLTTVVVLLSLDIFLALQYFC